MTALDSNPLGQVKFLLYGDVGVFKQVSNAPNYLINL